MLLKLKDGYVEIKDIFQESSDNEKEHAKIWFKLLNGGKVPDTLINLADVAAGEHYEWTEMYNEFAETAREEGFDDIADLFDAAGATEKVHEDRYNALSAKIKANEVFKKDEEIAWKCNNCGYIHIEKMHLKSVHYAITHKHTSENKTQVISNILNYN